MGSLPAEADRFRPRYLYTVVCDGCRVVIGGIGYRDLATCTCVDIVVDDRTGLRIDGADDDGITDRGSR